MNDKFKKMLSYIATFLGGIIAFALAIFGIKRNDKRGNIQGIDTELGRAEEFNNRERADIDRERRAIESERVRLFNEREEIGDERAIIDRERELAERDEELLAELERRSKQ